MKRFGLLALGLLIVIVVFVGWRYSSEIPHIPTHRMARGTFEDQLTTNGRLEPSVWASARAEREGLLVAVPVIKGQHVGKGAPLAILDAKDAQADLASATARIDEATASIQTLQSGGRRRDLVEIEESLKQRRAEKSQAEKDLAVAERLVARNAGTLDDVRSLRDKIELIQLQISGLDARRPALVGEAELSSARARLREAHSAAELARRRIELSTVRSPADGVVYQLDAKVGAYVSPGALIANVGQVEALKVLVFVDEPELGRVNKGMPVTITWDALEGKRWTGKIDRIPTQIVALGTRQVGEVECRIDNPGGTLLPGTNVNVIVQIRKQEGVLLVPKEAVRTRDGVGVFILENGTLAWKKVEVAGGNITSSIVVSGLKEGDVVALGPEAALKPGTKFVSD